MGFFFLIAGALAANAALAATPATLAIATGDGQSAATGALVTGPVCVVVTDAGGSPLPGIAVTWGSVTGGGSITGASQTTGAGGIATLGSWMLGPTTGANTITCTSAGLNSVTFTATATATGSASTGVAAKIAISTGNSQIAAPGAALPAPVCAIAFDAGNNPVAGVVITFGNVTGGGSITGAVQTTDATGIVTLGSWTLGPTPGENTVDASAAGLNTITFVATAQVEDPNENVVIRWDNALLRAIQNSSPAPTVAARAIGEVHTAIFDAWAAYDSKAVGTRLAGTLRRPASEQTTANKETAISYAAYNVLLDLFPKLKSSFDSVMATLSLDPTNASTDTTTPAGIGNTVASAILTFRHGDGSNQLGDLNPGAYSDYTSYAPVNDPANLNKPSNWQPLKMPNGQPQVYTTPQWGLVKPFAIGPASNRKSLMPNACATFPGKPYEKQAAEILTLSAGLNDLNKTIADYWMDKAGSPTPPGHWCTFGQFVSQRDHHTLDDDVKLFFALGNAELDVSIAVWDCKRHYDSVRPISAVRFLNKGRTIKAWVSGKGTQAILGETFQTYIPTPSFPEYFSGHSTFSAASAQVLSMFTKKSDFGLSVTIAPGTSPNEPGIPTQPVTLSWKKFKDAADQAGMSRRFGGIHFKDGDMQGRMLGKKIGMIVFKKAQQYIEGKVKP